jgi:hypothetical protein
MIPLAIDVSSTPPTWAGIITAAATLVLALTALLGGVTALVKVFLPIKRETAANTVAIAEVHTIVNKQRTDMENYQRALIRALQKHDVEVPEDQSIEQNPSV